MYLPFAQSVITSPKLLLRTDNNPVNLISALRSQVAQIDKNLPLYEVRTMDDAFSRSAAQQRFQALLVSGFAVMSLLLCAIGLYGLLSYLVAQRTLEIGVRLALGAPRQSVLTMVLSRGMVLAAIGVVMGIGRVARSDQSAQGYAVRHKAARRGHIRRRVDGAIAGLPARQLRPGVSCCPARSGQNAARPVRSRSPSRVPLSVRVEIGAEDLADLASPAWLMNDYATLYFNRRAPDNNLLSGVLVVIVGTALIRVGAATVFLRLAGRHSAISPTGLLTLAPAKGSRVARIGAVLISALPLPALIVVPVLASLLMLVSFLSVICE